jgi:hypothetical protein
MEIGIIFLQFFVSIGYLYLAYKVLIAYFMGIMFPLNSASRLFLVVGLIGFGLSLFKFNSIGIELLRNSILTESIVSGFGLYFLFLFLSFCFSIIIFRLTLLVNKVSTRENEKAELAKNSFLFAGIQSISFLFFIYLLADPVVKLALSRLSNLL